jgi:hypothetical protein
LRWQRWGRGSVSRWNESTCGRVVRGAGQFSDETDQNAQRAFAAIDLRNTIGHQTAV